MNQQISAAAERLQEQAGEILAGLAGEGDAAQGLFNRAMTAWSGGEGLHFRPREVALAVKLLALGAALIRLDEAAGSNQPSSKEFN